MRGTEVLASGIMRGEVRKIAVKRLIKDEKGQAMILAVILLLVGGLIVSSLLAYMGNGLLNGKVYEKRTAELYAADAGVEDAMWMIQNGNVTACPAQHNQPPYYINVNGKSVEIKITYMDGPIYHVASTATGDGSGTKIDAYIMGTPVYGNYTGITNQVITSLGTINEYGQVTIIPSTGENAPVANYDGSWPPPGELEDFYWQYVKDTTPYSAGTINLNGVNNSLGPLYRNGTLTIENSSNTPATLTLTGTIYVTGDTDIGVSGSGQNTLTLNLNGQTIFVESSSRKPPNPVQALQIGGKCTIEGPGVIIAIGDIYFAPKGNVGDDSDPVFILSVLGDTLLQPSGSFYGSVAGNVTVDVKSGHAQSINYPTGGFTGLNLNFPGFTEGQLVYNIASWEVSQQ